MCLRSIELYSLSLTIRVIVFCIIVKTMRFRTIAFENHPILGTISFDFTNSDGKAVDTVIIAGENGCGKSVLLNELFNYNPAMIADSRIGIILAEIELSPSDKRLIQGNQNFTLNHLPPIYGNIISIKQDFSIKQSWDQISVSYKSDPDHTVDTRGFIFSLNNQSVFKPVFSDVEINFTPHSIRNVTSSNIDEELFGAVKSSNDLATEITQLLIDIDNLDNADLAKWVRSNPNMAPPQSVQSVRMKRFTNAFHSMFPSKRFVGIDNVDSHKVVEFEEFGMRMPIEKLSSGEKQIVFRGGFLLRNQKTTEGSVVLIDEPEISLHPRWQLDILCFLKTLFVNSGEQTSQLIVATHSPFIIHNVTRSNDKVIVMKMNDNGVRTVCQNPEFYSWKESQLVCEAFNLDSFVIEGVTNVFLEGETDEKYFNKAMEVFGMDNSAISLKWIGRNKTSGGPENTGNSALNNAVSFFKANPDMVSSPIVMLYDCDTNKGKEDFCNLHIRTMTSNHENLTYKKGVENLLILPQDFDKEDFYSETTKIDDYGAVTVARSLDKMRLCNHICSLNDDSLRGILKNIKLEVLELLKIK